MQENKENEFPIPFSIDQERKEYHDKKKKKKIIKLAIVGVIWIVLIAFLLTPFTSYKMMSVTGNVYLTKNQVLDMANIKHTWWWIIDGDKLKNKLESYSNIDNVSVSFSHKGLSISILEKYPVASINKDNQTYYLMNVSSDKLLNKEDYPLKIKDPINVNDLDESMIKNFIIDYCRVDLDIREYFYDLDLIDKLNNLVILKGKINDSTYFEIETDITKIDTKLLKSQFNRIKEEILGKVSKDNVKYGSKDNPIYVKYNFSNVYEFEVLEVSR